MQKTQLSNVTQDMLHSNAKQYMAVPHAEKHNIHGVASAEIDLSDRNPNEHPSSPISFSHDHTWHPGFWRRFPWLGLGCLVCAILLTLAALVVLIESNNKAVSDWSVRFAPNVILSILNSGVSVCFAISIGQGIAISWWRRAIRGATVEELHHTWSFGSSIWALFKGYRFFNLCALSALLAKFTIIDAILFQRATTTYVALGPQRSVNLTWFPAKTLPTTAWLNEYANDTAELSDAFTVDANTFILSPHGNIDWTYGYRDCQGICYLDVPAPGFMVTCTNITKNIDPVADAAAGTLQTLDGNVITSDTDLFAVNFNVNWASKIKPYPWIGMNTTSYTQLGRNSSDSNSMCPGQLITHVCELRPATISHPSYVQSTNLSTKQQKNTVSQTSVSLGTFDDINGTYLGLESFDFDLGQISGFKFINWTATNVTTVPEAGGTSTIAGVMTVLQNQYKSRTYISTIPGYSGAFEISSEGQLSVVALDQYAYNSTGYEGVNWTCPPTYDDPISVIVTGLDTLAFITADDFQNRANFIAYAGSPDYDPGQGYEDFRRNVSSKITANQYQSEVHYSTNFDYLGVALALTFACVLGVLPTYWGWWELGRKVTLNPIEVANAFQAPLLAVGHSGSGYADDVIQATGSRRVRYEEVIDAREGPRHTFVIQ